MCIRDRHVPLIAISLLVTLLYGGLIWNMFPCVAKETTSWEGHLSGAIAGTICAIAFMEYGPQRPDPFADEEETPDEESGEEGKGYEEDVYKRQDDLFTSITSFIRSKQMVCFERLHSMFYPITWYIMNQNIVSSEKSYIQTQKKEEQLASLLLLSSFPKLN